MEVHHLRWDGKSNVSKSQKIRMRAVLLIKNVEIIDGTGGPAFFGAIALKDEKILAVIKALESSDAAVGTCEGADASAEEEPKYVEYGSE